MPVRAADIRQVGVYDITVGDVWVPSESSLPVWLTAGPGPRCAESCEGQADDIAAIALEYDGPAPQRTEPSRAEARPEPIASEAAASGPAPGPSPSPKLLTPADVGSHQSVEVDTALEASPTAGLVEMHQITTPQASRRASDTGSKLAAAGAARARARDRGPRTAGVLRPRA